MSQTRVWTCDHSTVVRKTDTGTLGQGCGGNTRLLVGRSGATGTRRNYTSYLHYDQVWDGVGKIVSAIMTVYTDDFGLSGWPAPSASDVPKVTSRRLADSFTEGNNVSGNFDSSDYTVAGGFASGQSLVSMQKAANLVTNIDVTAIIEATAPKTVKRRDGTPGGGATNYGIGLIPSTKTAEAWSGWSRHAAADKRPFITLTYELGVTIPTVALTSPVGDVAAIGAFEGDFDDVRTTDILASTQVQVYAAAQIKAGTATASNDNITVASHGFLAGQEVWFHSLTGGVGLAVGTRYYVKSPNAGAFLVSLTPGGATVNITTNYSALTVGRLTWSATKTATDTEVINKHFNVLPDALHIPVRTDYQWRARVLDNEGQWSAWSSLVTFRVTNTDPDAPTTTPDNASSFDTLNGVAFRGDFSDPDGDDLLAYEVQMSAYDSGDSHWDDAGFIKWDTGKVYVAQGDTTWETTYGGQDLTAGTWHWRARVWDEFDGVSDWTYRSLVLTTDFDADPGSQTVMQVSPRAPWRAVIKEMKFNAIGGALTGVAATNLITSASAHGITTNRKVRFGSLTGGSGLFVGRDYYVIASGLTATAFKVSETLGGSEVDFTTAITAGTLTAITTRGPGEHVAIIENAKSVGASIMYNSPGEMHFTLVVDHPQIAVIEPKQTHYSIQFYTGDGWAERYAGLVDDFDATETSVVFTGIDYLGLLDYTMDERYFPSDPNRDFSKGGSYYSNQTLRAVIIDQLTKVARVTDSPVGFIGQGAIATMDEKVSIYSTMQPILSFVGGLLDSHRQGTGKRTRIQVKRTTLGAYEFVIVDDPGVIRDNLRLRYGELVQGYRVIAFGSAWASVINAIGRTREGIRVLYKTQSAPGIDPHVWGRFARAMIMDNVSDELDLDRRAQQAAIHAGKLGAQIGLGVRTQLLGPMNGYDVCDLFPVSIVHGAVNTGNFGSGYWACYGVTWEAGDDASQTVTLTLIPRDDTVAPAVDLIDAQPISPQLEWQIGWTPPDPLKATSKFWVDQTTGIRYYRDDTGALIAITGSTTT